LSQCNCESKFCNVTAQQKHEKSETMPILVQTCILGDKISFNAAVASECHFQKASDETSITDIMTRIQQPRCNTMTAWSQPVQSTYAVAQKSTT